MVRLGPECVNGYGRPISPLLPAGLRTPPPDPTRAAPLSHIDHAPTDLSPTDLSPTDLSRTFPTERAPFEGFSSALAHVP